MKSITSVELNYLVYRYLQESGFERSAFVLENEAGVNRNPVDCNLVPPGSLIKVVQKGLQCLEKEANTSKPVDLITKDLHELQRIESEKTRSLTEDQAKEFDRDRKRKRDGDDRRQDREKGANTDGDRKFKILVKNLDDKGGRKNHDDRDGELEREGKSGTEKDGESMKGKDGESGSEKDEKSGKESGGKYGKEKIKISGKQTDNEIPISDVAILEGHSSEVFACAWSPSGSLLASVSADSTARIWRVTDTSSRLHNASVSVVLLKHANPITKEKSKDVTTLDWNEEGTLLATGSYDGRARIWGTKGGLNSTLYGHKGAIFCMKWNKDNFLLTGGCDRKAILWDVKTEQLKQLFKHHKGPVLDVDWRNSVSFATCSTDHKIYVCEVGERHPIKCFAGHLLEVNSVKWDPTGTLLASCSDDSTAKVWNLEQDAYVHDLTDHSMEIHSIRWSPTGRGTNNPNQNLVLARK